MPKDPTPNDRTPNDRTLKDIKSKITEHRMTERRIGPNVEYDMNFYTIKYLKIIIFIYSKPCVQNFPAASYYDITVRLG